MTLSSSAVAIMTHPPPRPQQNFGSFGVFSNHARSYKPLRGSLRRRLPGEPSASHPGDSPRLRLDHAVSLVGLTMGTAVMDPERWRQLERLYCSARGRAAGARGAFLGGACQGDDRFRIEIVSMLPRHPSRDLTPDLPPID